MSSIAGSATGQHWCKPGNSYRVGWINLKSRQNIEYNADEKDDWAQLKSHIEIQKEYDANLE